MKDGIDFLENYNIMLLNTSLKDTIMLKNKIVLFLATLSVAGYAGTNAVELNRVLNVLKSEEAEAKLEVAFFAQQNNIKIRQVLSNGEIMEMQKIVDGIPYFYITQNANAALSTRANKLWAAPYGITGSGYNKIGEWDGGAVRATHQELVGRVIQKDSPASTHYHATHVAGTIIASGVDVQAKGMAYQATLDAYDWNSDGSEMASAAANGMEISNHSYGYITGWYGSSHWFGHTSISQNEAFTFGFYSSASQNWDNISYNAPNYLIVKAAGNDRNDVAPASGTVHTHNGSGSYTDTHYSDGYDNGGYDTVGTQGVAKNILTVGAVDDVPVYSSPSSVNMSSFSGWGPTDDGRIKPDVVGNGIGLYSTSDGSDTDYISISGTSMATPNVVGTLALLQQYYQSKNQGTPMRSATLKALVLHTADEAGSSVGPDYKYGWGLVNAEKAAEVITKDEGVELIVESTLLNGGSYTRDITLSGDEISALRVTIVWTDPAGTPVSASLDPSDKMLVNDLDIHIVKNGMSYYPWKLDKNNPANAATRNSKNDVDNVEQVLIDNPEEGTYTVVVNHAGSLSASQDFSIVFSHGNQLQNISHSIIPVISYLLF